MTITAPVIRYHGAKFRLAPWVLQHFPPHTCYVESFSAAAGVLMQKRRPYAEVFNDLDGDIVNLFRVLQDPVTGSGLTERLVFTPYSREEFELSWEPSTEPVERARRTIFAPRWVSVRPALRRASQGSALTRSANTAQPNHSGRPTPSNSPKLAST